MESNTPRTLSISRNLRISMQMLALRKTFGKDISENSKIQDVKVQHYFERAFTRWIFNTVMAGINPFVDLVTTGQFISQDDIMYFAKKHNYIQKFQHFNWDWLSFKFKQIWETSAVPCGRIKKVTVDNKVTLMYEWSDIDTISYTMNINMYNRACSIYVGPRDKQDEHILVLMSRYDACGTTNNHCSVPPSIVSFCNITTEMFGSPINTCAMQYCSPFPDIEQYFGSLGSFFDPRLRLSSGVYLCNPPYDETIMAAAVSKVIKALESNAEITVVVVLPVWDSKSQKEVKGRLDLGMEFEAHKMLLQCGFIRSQMMLDFATYPFFDYYLNASVKITDTHLIVLSNANCELNVVDISQQWSKIQSN